MRFATTLFGAFAVLASAQSTTVATTTVTSDTTSVSLAPAESSQAACLGACQTGDVNCQAKCISVPAPSAQQANATNECVGNCNQGNGTAADNAAYADCVNSCVSNNYFTSTGTPAETTAAAGSSGSAASAASASASATGTSGSVTSGSGSSASGSSTGTKSSSSASATSSSSAADGLRVGVTGASFFGLLVAFMAL